MFTKSQIKEAWAKRSSLLTVLFVAGCSATGGLTLQQAVADAQLAAQALCAVAPSLDAITKIIIANDKGAMQSEAQAQAAAQIFCSAVTGNVTKIARVKARRVVRLADGSVNYGQVVVNGQVIDIIGTPIK